MGKASRLKRERKGAKRDLLARVESTNIAPILSRRPQARGQPKISSSLGELISPYVDDNAGIDEYRRLVTLGAVAWNCAVQPDLLSDERLREILAAGETSNFESLYPFIEELKERKKRCFPDDRRFILDTEVREQSDGSFYLLAAAAGQE